jgi:hypothetical protein
MAGKDKEEASDKTLTEEILSGTKSKIEEKLERQVTKKKRSKKQIFALSTGALIATIILLFAFFFLLSKLTINIGDELQLAVKPFQQSHTIHTGKSANLTFQVTNNNLFQCTSTCSFALYDHRTGEQIHTSQEFLKHGQKIEKSFEVNAPPKGEGETLYTFEAWCHNIKSLICATEEAGRYTASSALVIYQLEEDERKVKENKELFDAFITQSREISLELNQTSIVLDKFPRGIQEIEEVKRQKDSIASQVANLNTQANALELYWNNQDYKKIINLYSEEDLEKLEEIKQNITNLNSKIENTSIIRNQSVTILENATASIDLLVPAVNFYQTQLNPANAQRLSRILNTSRAIDEQYLTLSKSVLHSEEASHNKIINYTTPLPLFLKEYTIVQNQLIFNELYITHLLQIKGKAMTETINMCQDLKVKYSQIQEENNEALERQENLTANQSNILDNLDQVEENMRRVALQRAASDITTMDLSYIEESLEEINISLNNILAVNVSLMAEDYIEYATMNLTREEKIFLERCEDENFTSKSDDEPFKRLAALTPTDLRALIVSAKPTQNTTDNNPYAALEGHPPQCCAFGKCEACCTQETCKQKNYPVLFLHGHAFNEKNSPESSLGVFNSIQTQFQTEGYLSLGKLDLEEGAVGEDGRWGLTNATTTMTASYYYISHYQLGDYSVSIRNDESIETYAIRLREIIDTVKRKTGKDKVHIVAHSMGGLVAREYILLFGSEDIATLVTVNTPHQGISGRTQEWCTFLGSKKECEEMSQGSIFMSRLASRQLPTDLPAYAIRSTGCPMDNGETGDGVVTNQSGMLPGAVNIEIKSQCTDPLQSNLHNQALDPDKNPEVYQAILSIIDNSDAK